MQKTRICKQCGVEHSLTETNFPRHHIHNNKICYRNYCTKCFNENHKAYNDALYHSSLNHVFNRRLGNARDRAKYKSLEFDLTIEYLHYLWEKQNGKCYYSGLQMTYERNDIHAVSIDRINSSLGYTKDNVVLACSTINVMKNSHSIDEFINLCRSVVEHADTTNLY